MYRVIKRSLALMALIAALAAVSAPLASARFDVSQPTPNSSAPAGQVVITAPAESSGSDGFDWGDAAIGAAAVVTILGLGTAAALGLRHSHPATS